MSAAVGIRELRQQASAVLRRVKAGETVEVTEHGHPIARIVPLRQSSLEQLVSEGVVRPAEGDLLELLAGMDLPAQPAGPRLPSDALAELRAGEK
jgi:prevent-host-death family protein